MSTLRARCPDCRTITAVAVDDEYQCHSCGREYAAGLVRVPRAWGAGGEAMAAAARVTRGRVVDRDGRTLAGAAFDGRESPSGAACGDP